ncbi:Carboxylesterase type B [Penicillium verhagenii]|uniref:Carboxylesterase type B n=1 Tax=Penicillium verhagenii TaxID=1562060 RepID=UPI0025456346|nr:Carboxylesterase type B [Penicillium verhagenii]KAJ5919198.1 Carboxylesterase type B [Penicillium verhagenii]
MKISEHLARGTSIFALLAAADAALYDQTIKLPQGKLQGAAAFNTSTAPSTISNWKDISVWKGIPYAPTTGGNNRWKPPQPAPSWNGTFKATSFGLSCPDQSTGDDIGEDCLSINIWSPATSADAKLPVMFWSYAAGGQSSQSNYDGGGMAGKDVVFVSYNYRSGAPGWLTLAELEKESGVTGNYGLLDQIAALKWVHENIAAFGGDPDAITAAGQSFGSGATYHLINSHLSKGLIKGAIAESGIKDPYDPDLSGFGSDYRNMTWMLDFSNAFYDSLNVSSLAELRALDLATLLTGTGESAFTGFDPVLNYHSIPNKYIVSLEEGAPNNVPILVGNNADEDGIDSSTTYNVSAYKEGIASLYGDFADDLLALNPASNTTAATDAYNTILRAGFSTSTWSFANRWSNTSDQPIYNYLWTYQGSNGGGATHGSEVVYALGNLYAQSSTYDETDYEVAEKMSSYWANFVKTQNPNKGGSANVTLPYWAANVPSQNNQFDLGNTWKKIPITASLKMRDIFLDFWKTTTDPY